MNGLYMSNKANIKQCNETVDILTIENFPAGFYDFVHD